MAAVALRVIDLSAGRLLGIQTKLRVRLAPLDIAGTRYGHH